jgi:hypothetical protein
MDGREEVIKLQKTKAKLSPRQAKTNAEVCALRRDNLSAGNFWMLVDDGEVTITAQKPGESSTAMITMSKRNFNRLIDWYNKP